ncbi:hypothetical protein BH24GEM2_BH24GEM2_00050 [soil metagenome]
MTDPEKYRPPSTKLDDHAYIVARGTLTSVPLVGGAATELFSALLTAPLERRRQRWMEEIADGLRRLEQQHRLDLAQLQNSESFVTTLVLASAAAQRAHQEEKIAALRNAVLNSTGNAALNDDLQSIFIRYIDELTPTHIVLLRFLAENEERIAHAASYSELFEAFANALATSATEPDGFKLLCADLANRVLLRFSQSMDDLPGVHQAGVLITEEEDDYPMVIVTSMGRAFLELVSTP